MPGLLRAWCRALRQGPALTCLVLAGAAAAEGPGTPASLPVWHRVQVVAQPGANQDEAVALDIVVVHDVALMPRMPVTADLWFAQRVAFQAGAGRGISVVSLQVPPGSRVPAVKLPPRMNRAAGVLVYAGLKHGAGPTAAPLAPHHCVRIELAQQLAQLPC